VLKSPPSAALNTLCWSVSGGADSDRTFCEKTSSQLWFGLSYGDFPQAGHQRRVAYWQYPLRFENLTAAGDVPRQGAAMSNLHVSTFEKGNYSKLRFWS
jgi:hypothetical protein